MISLPRHGLFATLYLFLLIPGRLTARQQLPPFFDIHYCTHYDDENGLPSNDITGFFEDRHGYLWFTTQFGLERFDGREFRTWYTGNTPTLAFNRLYSLNSRSTDTLFFSDESKDVHIVDAEGQIKPMPGVRAGQNFLMSPHSFILDLRAYFGRAEDSARIRKLLLDPECLNAMHEFYPDTNGNAWFLSRKHINYFEQGHFREVDTYDVEREAHFRIKKTLFKVDISGSSGYFWIPTNKGLFQVARSALETWLGNKDQEVYYHYYDKYGGFASNEFNGGCSPVGIRLQDGTFSLPSMKGMVWFKPQQVNPAMPGEKIYVDRLTIDTQEIKFNGPIRLAAGSRKFRFHISSPFFGNAANFAPEFRVRGVDKLWTPVATDNTIGINYLPPWKYILEIRLRNGFGAGAWTTTEKSFSIAPHVYQTLAFQLAGPTGQQPRDFVAKLNGRIMVESSLETGTTVTILFHIL